MSDELSYKARPMFPLLSLREHNFVAGLSMGGYGALKLGLRNSDSFGAAQSLSGTCALAGLRRRPEELALIFGDAAGVRKSGEI